MNKFRILIVEDNEPIRRIYAMKLENEWYNIRIAESGNNAIAIAKEWRPDLVILDIMMPDGTGEDFINAFPDRDFHVVVVSHKESVDFPYDKFFPKITSTLNEIITYINEYAARRHH